MPRVGSSTGARYRVLLRLGLGLFFSLGPLWAAAAPKPIASVADVRNLSPEEADHGIPVQIRGTVTRCSRLELYLEDSTGALFVAPANNGESYQPGDYIEITGKTAAGHFLPMLIEESSRRLGRAALPEPAVVSYDDFASGRMDCRYVEVSGVIRGAEVNALGGVTCRLAMNGALLRVEIADLPESATKLIAATVRLRGVAGAVKNRERQIIQPLLWVAPSPDSLQILSPPPNDIFALEARPIATLMSSNGLARSGHLAKISGQVVWAESDTHVYIRDDTDTIEINLQTPAPLRVGDIVEVAGFPETGLIKPHLSEAVARVLGRGRAPLPQRVTAERLLSRNSDATLVEIEAAVRETFRASDAVTLVLCDGPVTFHASFSRDPSRPVDLPPVGSRVVLAGISMVEKTTTSDSLLATPTSFQIKLRGPQDIHIVSRPSFWTTRRLLIAIGGLSSALLLAAAWISSLRRTVARQTGVIVSQTRSEATFEERDRIARELHDTLEQQLTGATILLDATVCAYEQQSETVRTHLDTARAMLRHSLDEAQRAVSNLRSRELERGNLGAALEHSLRRMVAQTDVKLLLEFQGNLPLLDGIAENHLLRVAQEAVTNALKHASSTEIRVCLTVNSHALRLTIEDNGRGVDSESGSSPQATGKFGLMGMRERADKLHGELSLHSWPGRGTRVDFVIPIEPHAVRNE